MFTDHNDELYCKSKEEEKVELEEGNINLFVVSAWLWIEPRGFNIPGKQGSVSSSASLPRYVCRWSKRIHHIASMLRY